MNIRSYPRLLCLAIFCLALVVTAGQVRVHAASHNKYGLRPSDPQLTGPRDMNYDHVIVPGERMGPVRVGGRVSDAVKYLGNPDFVYPHSDVPTYGVDYVYKEECITFRWVDSGAEPVIDRGIWVTCNKWSTSNGLQVGSSMQNVIGLLGQRCDWSLPDGALQIYTDGISFFFKGGRNSPVFQITMGAKTGNSGCN